MCQQFMQKSHEFFVNEQEKVIDFVMVGLIVIRIDYIGLSFNSQYVFLSDKYYRTMSYMARSAFIFLKASLTNGPSGPRPRGARG